MFLDTSGLLCLHNSAEPHHALAKRLFKRKRIRVTSSYVLAELITLAFARALPRPKTLQFVRELIQGQTVTVFWIDVALHLRAMDLLARRIDKNYSLCDAVSFVIMRERDITEAL